MKLPVVATMLLAASCASPWERYDSSLFSSVFEPNQQTIDGHISNLETLTAWEVPPPGLCAELAYFLALAGRNSEAQVWLDRELQVWPESAMVVEALRKLIEEPQPEPEQQLESPVELNA